MTGGQLFYRASPTSNPQLADGEWDTAGLAMLIWLSFETEESSIERRENVPRGIPQAVPCWHGVNNDERLCVVYTQSDLSDPHYGTLSGPDSSGLYTVVKTIDGAIIRSAVPFQATGSGEHWVPLPAQS